MHARALLRCGDEVFLRLDGGVYVSGDIHKLGQHVDAIVGILQKKNEKHVEIHDDDDSFTKRVGLLVI